MPGLQLGYTIDDAQVRKLLEQAPAAVLAGLRQLVEGAAIDVQREMRIQAPIAVTGQLRGSVRYNSRRLQPQYAFRPIRLPVEPRPMPTDVLDRFETFERGRWYSGWLKSVLPIALFDAKTTE